MSANENLIEFQKQRIEALERELKKAKDTLSEISEISTKESLRINVILN